MVDDLNATLGLTELNLGIIPGWGDSTFAPLIGRAKAREVILLTNKINGQEALKIGRVDQLSKSGKLMDNAPGSAQRLPEMPPIAVSFVLKGMTPDGPRRLRGDR